MKISKASSLRIPALTAALGLLLISTGCASTAAKRLHEAATTQGTIKAGVDIPDQPEECRQHMPRVYPTMKEKPRDTQLRWEFVADNEDRRIDRCALFHDSVRTNFSTATKGQ